MAGLLVGALMTAVAMASEGIVPAAASFSKFTPQEKYLALANTGNFACRVNSVRVITESPGEGKIDVEADHIRLAFTNVATLEWAHIAQTSFATLDGRNDEKVLATPGGDMGEFITALNAVSKAANRAFSQEDVTRFFERYLRLMTRDKFSYQTDERSYIRLALASGCRNLHVAEMGGMKRKREAFLEQVAKPEHIGDMYIRYLAINATDLDLNPDYIQYALTAYHNVLWSTPSNLAQKLCYLEVKGSHNEAALVHIRTSPFCVDQGLAPMVSQQLACPAPVLINYPDAVRVLRRELVAVLTEGINVNPADVMMTYNTIAESTLEKFWGDFGRGLPVYTVEFSSSSPLLTDDQ